MPVESPSPRARAARKKPRRGVAGLLSRLGVKRWPRRRVVLAGVVVIAATGIAVNALVLQSARHPAPLFAAVEQARVEAARKAAAQRAAAAVAAQASAQTSAQAPRAPAPLPPTRPATEQAAAPAPQPPQPVPAAPAPQPPAPGTESQSLARMMAEAAEKPARPATADKPPQTQARSAQPKPDAPKGDALGELIRGGILPPGGIPSEPDPKIQQAQRALARLGATGVKPDGFMGPATRAAIERFERDRKWPVTGELSPRLMRELGVQSAARP